MNVTILTDTPFGDEDAWLEFLGVHEIAHQSIAQALARRGVVVARPPLSGDPAEDQAWLLAHGELHRAEARALGFSFPDIETVDLTDEAEYRDWMRLHGAIHAAENEALGIR